MTRHNKSCFRLLVLLSAPSLMAQATSSVQLLDGHFVGTWIGINQDCSLTPMRALNLRVTVVEDPRKHRLQMDYEYVDPGQSTTEQYRRLLTFEPATSIVVIDRKGFGGKQRQRAYGLDVVLRKGYGDFTLHAIVRYQGDKHAVERADYHLSADKWNY